MSDATLNKQPTTCHCGRPHEASRRRGFPVCSGCYAFAAKCICVPLPGVPVCRCGRATYPHESLENVRRCLECNSVVADCQCAGHAGAPALALVKPAAEPPPVDTERLERLAAAGWNIDLTPNAEGQVCAYNEGHGSVCAISPAILLDVIEGLEKESTEAAAPEKLEGPGPLQKEEEPAAPSDRSSEAAGKPMVKVPRSLFAARTTSGNMTLCNGCLSRFFAEGVLFEGDPDGALKLSGLLTLRPASPVDPQTCLSCDPMPPAAPESTEKEGASHA